MSGFSLELDISEDGTMLLGEYLVELLLNTDHL